MNSNTAVIGFLCVVFAAVFVLMLGITNPASGNARQQRTLRRRLAAIGADAKEDVASLLREKYLTSLTPAERRLEELPLMEGLAQMSEQAGKPSPGYRVVFSSVLLGAVLGVVSGALLHALPIGIAAAVAGLLIPYLRLSMLRRQRMNTIEEQLPDAIDVIKRALRAGHPFNSAIKLVADDMDGPIAQEFGLMFTDLNYGSDVRRALLGLLNRMPSVTVMALVTSVLVQRETGGNLAEILDQIGKVVRSRFRLGRRIRSLSAEGKMSAWVLAMVPVALAGLMSFTAPTYLPILFTDPLGHKMLYGAGTLGVIGVLWIRKIIRIEV
ncbi:MAG TPA: type II secretion system F family protein [Steroidobacteraceae bacterium]